MKIIPDNEIEKAALNNTKSIDRIDGFKAGVEFAESKFEELAVEFAKYLFSREITRNSSKEDEMVYTPPEFNLMKGDLIKNGKELFNNFLKERMAKYKLKKWYPSLPKDWEIGIEVEKCTIDKRYYVSNQWYKPLISQTEVENNPEFWEKVEDKPILITEDGKEINEGDNYWVWDYGCLKGTSSEVHAVFNASCTHTGDGINRKYFSTKEAAEKYIDENKPLYSKKDMLNFAEFHCNLQFYSHHRWGIEKDFDVWKLKKGN
jgi:hypothetical protein